MELFLLHGSVQSFRAIVLDYLQHETAEDATRKTVIFESDCFDGAIVERRNYLQTNPATAQIFTVDFQEAFRATISRIVDAAPEKQKMQSQPANIAVCFVDVVDAVGWGVGIGKAGTGEEEAFRGVGIGATKLFLVGR